MEKLRKAVPTDNCYLYFVIFGQICMPIEAHIFTRSWQYIEKLPNFNKRVTKMTFNGNSR